MKVARILAPVHTLGPGRRICLWTQGCSKRCYKCMSSELQKVENKEVMDIPAEKLANIIIKLASFNECDRLTISGGDPFEQLDELNIVLKRVRYFFKDILVYTGYRLDQIENGECTGDGLAALNLIDVLVDGPYIDELNNKNCSLKGSENQNIYFFNRDLCHEYEKYMEQGRMVETFSHDGEVVLVGILNRGE